MDAPVAAPVADQAANQAANQAAINALNEAIESLGGNVPELDKLFSASLSVVTNTYTQADAIKTLHNLTIFLLQLNENRILNKNRFWLLVLSLLVVESPADAIVLNAFHRENHNAFFGRDFENSDLLNVVASSSRSCIPAVKLYLKIVQLSRLTTIDRYEIMRSAQEILSSPFIANDPVLLTLAMQFDTQHGAMRKLVNIMDRIHEISKIAALINTIREGKDRDSEAAKQLVELADKDPSNATSHRSRGSCVRTQRGPNQDRVGKASRATQLSPLILFNMAPAIFDCQYCFIFCPTTRKMNKVYQCLTGNVIIGKMDGETFAWFDVTRTVHSDTRVLSRLPFIRIDFKTRFEFGGVRFNENGCYCTEYSNIEKILYMEHYQSRTWENNILCEWRLSALDEKIYWMADNKIYKYKSTGHKIEITELADIIIWYHGLHALMHVVIGGILFETSGTAARMVFIDGKFFSPNSEIIVKSRDRIMGSLPEYTIILDLKIRWFEDFMYICIGRGVFSFTKIDLPKGDIFIADNLGSILCKFVKHDTFINMFKYYGFEAATPTFQIEYFHNIVPIISGTILCRYGLYVNISEGDYFKYGYERSPKFGEKIKAALH